jgi:formiminoglutamase
MDIRYYFKPVHFLKIQNGTYLKKKNSLGYTIEKNTSLLTSENLNTFQVAIIGISDDTNTLNKGCSHAPDRIREFLYPLATVDQNVKIIDLGNLKKGIHQGDLYYAVRDVVDYLNDAKVTVLVLGGGQDLGIGIARAFKQEKYFQMSTIDPKIDIKSGREKFSSSNYISRILRESPDIFHVNFIGYQSYFVSSEAVKKVRYHQFEAIRLGKLREDISLVEPLLRDSHFVSFDISSLRIQDAPGYYDGSPNGLCSDEACEISKYAGYSNTLCVFGLFEVNPQKDIHDQTSRLAAQIIWYFLEGFTHRIHAEPERNTTDFIQYNVETEDPGAAMIFYQHTPTNRWWMRLEGLDKKSILVSCREADYKLASKKEIPPKWLMFLRKIDQLLK